MPDDRRRAAIYARFSTDLQSDRSIDDQFALCRACARREGLTVTATYADRAMTSASMIGRDGLLSLMEDGRAGRFDVVIVEALDRLSRDQGDLAALHKRLSFAGVGIVTVHGGAASELEVGVQGLLGQLWLGQLKDKIRRGQAGVVRDGRHAGGRAYGYRPVAGTPGRLRIVEEEAEVVRRIYRAYAAGDSPRAIAAALNADGILPPRGARWNASTLNGNPGRGHGILSNELYRGWIVWNRVRMIRDPDTGRRVSRVNPREDWQWQAAPELRIVDDALFAAVRARKESRAATSGTRGRALARPRRPFSGLLRCGVCGGGMSITRKGRSGAVYVRCTTARESGGCTQTRQPRLDRIEAAIFDRLRAELSDPVYVRAYLAEYHAERQRLAAAARKDRRTLERAAARARGAYERAHELYVQGVTDGDEAKENIRRLLDAMRAAEAQLAEADAETPVVELHPAATARYMAALADLGPDLCAGGGAPTRHAIDTLRELVSAVVVTPTVTGVDVLVEGYLSALVGPDHAMCRHSVVAEERLGSLPTMQLARIAVG